MTYLLLKSEPESFSIDHLRRAKDKTTIWDGVRNFQARNHMLSATPGDLALFYHSNANPPGIAGLCEILEVGIVDPTQFKKSSKYFDPTSKRDDPRWRTIKVRFVEKFANFVTLEELRALFSPDDLIILKQGSRLSVTPVADEVALRIRQLAGSAFTEN